MNGPAVKSPNTPTEAVSAIVRELQTKLFVAHGLLSCARAKIDLEMDEGDDPVHAIGSTMDLAMAMLYEVASKTESVAIRRMADAWHPEPVTETEED